MNFLARILITLFCFLNCAQTASAQDWQEANGEHFIVCFTQDKDFAENLLDKAETYYRNIALDLGYARYSEFWLWDKRVKIYIYPDHASFIKATGQPEWSQGMADYRTKQIISYAWSQGFLESLLPHEMAHLIFRDFVGFKGEVPLWLDEGVAQWEEELRRKEMKQMVYKLYNDDSLLGLNDMLKLDIREIREKDRVYIRPTRTKNDEPGILFVSGNNLIRTFYIQSFGLVGFLIEKYGSENFANFCRQLRDGKTLEEALRFAYPTYIRSISELEDRWRKYLKESYL
ncbi:MAG: hypothetical protein NTW64_04540 [Candidatus Omnitrophica bacterium]|nr:hypothetical protein [Candidatus Omnitrophota bacterium]